ncbi:MAG: bifunctional proline dehydrogenase/L-glutamate gamma-semialdehyde dehydrogenase [Nitrospirae bacterium]|nr:bifunctional proline dehydrogenase/L-glutamate gamma-semialdehyde dehydrogenase [Nitrospirota bacterium]
MPEVSSPLEPIVYRIGEQLARLSAGRTPTLFEGRWWSHTALNLAMQDSHFKAQLFRFIDVLPSITDDEQVVTLAREYLGDGAPALFGGQWGLKALSATSLGAWLSGKAIRSQVEHMARTFIAGATVEEAAPRLTDLWQHGRAWSVDLLGEATISDREADRYRDRCTEALTLLAREAALWPSHPLLDRDHLGPTPRVQLSIKVSALSPHLDPIDPEGSYRSVAMRLRPILDLAMRLPASLIFDMEQADTKTLLVEIFTRLFTEPSYKDYPYAGLALQAYHRDTVRDIEELLAWVRRRGTPITIRLVKGAYWDSDTIRYRQRGWAVPLFEHKVETDANYESLTYLLLSRSSLIRPAFGTHNLRTLAYIEAVAESLKLPPETWEYQMIFGMAEPFQHAVMQYGRRLRLYTPVGELLPGMAYLVRRLLENTSNESFLRKEYVESHSLSTLLAPPVLEEPSQKHPLTSHHVEMQEFQNEPQRDFAQADNRAAMHQALATVRSQLGRQWVSSSGGLRLTGPAIESRNPGRPDEVVGRLSSASSEDVEQAVRQAVQARESWRDATTERRVEILRAAAAIMRTRRDELAAWEILECGKPWREADADVAEAIDFLEFYATDWRRLAYPKRLGQEPGELNQRLYSPRGVTVVIAPWNFPLAIPTGMVSAALVTGNPVIFKPSERSPMMGHWLTEILRKAGVPEEVLCCLPGGPDIGRALVRHPEIATVAFTGSKDVGLGILKDAGTVMPGQHMVKRVLAEMGGKNAIIIDETADLDDAITGVVSSFTGYAGQKCSACSRAIVHAAIYENFLDRLKEAVLSLRIGSPEDPGTQVGPVIDRRAQSKIQDYIEIGKKEARLLVEGTAMEPGWYIGPTVFADVAPTHRVAQEEIFGPILSVLKAASFQAALTLANSTAYALTGGVYSRSPANLEQARQQFDVGNLYLNRPITGALVGRQPFGGHRLSGVGAKAGGEEYLTQFVVTRVISEQTLRRGFAPPE